MKQFISLGLMAVALSTASLSAQSGTYCTWDESAHPRADRDRVIRRLTVSGATQDGQAMPFSLVVAGENATTQRPINYDLTGNVLHVTRGDQLKLTATTHNLFWTHFYLYADYNKDFTFGTDGRELVSYTHYSSDGTTYYNSLGFIVQAGEVANELPVFTVPADAPLGRTRMRFKADWNSLAPCGSNAGGNALASVRGTIVDFTIEVHDRPSETLHRISYDVPESMVNFSLRKLPEGTEITSGSTVPEGSQVEVSLSAKEGYRLTDLRINDTNRLSLLTDGKLTLTISVETTIAVQAVAIQPTMVNMRLEVEGEGSVVVADGEGLPVDLSSGPVKIGEPLNLIAFPNTEEGYEIEGVWLSSGEEGAELIPVQLFGEFASFTPTIDTHVLIVKFRRPSSLDLPNASVSVYASVGQVVIRGAEAGSQVAIYSINGKLVYQGLTNSTDEQIALPTAGTYLVRIGEGKATATHKITL